MKIKITVPKEENGKWLISFKGTPYQRKDATLVMRLLERKLSKTLASRNEKKIAIVVKYEDNATNETEASFDVSYLLWATSCFLEDYLSKEMLKKFAKSYLIRGAGTKQNV